MKRKLYYTTSNIDEIKEYKNISVYYIKNDKILLFCEIESKMENNSEIEIQTYLDNNGYGDEEFEMANL